MLKRCLQMSTIQPGMLNKPRRRSETRTCRRGTSCRRKLKCAPLELKTCPQSKARRQTRPRRKRKSLPRTESRPWRWLHQRMRKRCPQGKECRARLESAPWHWSMCQQGRACKRKRHSSLSTSQQRTECTCRRSLRPEQRKRPLASKERKSWHSFVPKPSSRCLRSTAGTPRRSAVREPLKMSLLGSLRRRMTRPPKNRCLQDRADTKRRSFGPALRRTFPACRGGISRSY